MTKLRVMGIDECGTEFCIATDITHADRAERIVDECLENHVEWRSVWVEHVRDYYAEHAARYARGEEDLW
jgi:hypothetical protein